MSDPVTWGVVGAVVGAGVTGTAAYIQGERAEDAAFAASARQADAANTTAAVSASENAAAPTEAKAKAKRSVDSSALRRASLRSTVNRYAGNGLRKTLG